MRILLSIPLSPFSGYGRDGLGLTQALVRAGHDVYLHPTAVQPPLPEDIAHLLTKELSGPFDLGIVHLAPDQLAVSETLRLSCRTLIGWSMWEYTSLSNSPGHTKFRKSWKDYDALIAYDEVTASCMKEYFSGPIYKVQGGFDPTGFEYVDRDWDDDPFYFGMIGVLSNRKNPFAAINAFSQLSHEEPELMKNARLILKTTGPGLHPNIEDVMPGVRIVYDVWNEKQVKDFYTRVHVLLAPSRGEGKNLPCLEAMSTGAGVIATDWGGHHEWMDESYAYPLDYSLIKVDIYKGNSPLWADARVDHLKVLMKNALINRAEVQKKGRRAAQVIPQLCSWDSRVVELFEKLEPVL